MPKFVLASSSPFRLNLLRKINFVPDIVEGANIDETPYKKEKPLDYVKRMAETKAETLNQKYFGNIILAADTIVNYQTRIIQKPKDKDELISMIKSYSNRSIKLITSVYLIKEDNKRSRKTVITSVKFKPLNQRDIDDYMNIKDIDLMINCGGIAFETLMESFVVRIIGYYSNILGLPLYTVRNMLISAGVKN